MSGVSKPLRSQWNDKTLQTASVPLVAMYSKQVGCLGDCLMRAILRSRPLHLHLWENGGDEEWCGCLLCQQTASCLSRARRPLRTAHDLLSQAEVSIYLKVRCQWCDRWEEDRIFSFSWCPADHWNTPTAQFTASVFPFRCEFLCVKVIPELVISFKVVLQRDKDKLF